MALLMLADWPEARALFVTQMTRVREAGRGPPVSTVPPPPTPAQRLASADALVREGCLDCLIDAFGHTICRALFRRLPRHAWAVDSGAPRSIAFASANWA